MGRSADAARSWPPSLSQLSAASSSMLLGVASGVFTGAFAGLGSLLGVSERLS